MENKIATLKDDVNFALGTLHTCCLIAVDTPLILEMAHILIFI